MKLMFLPVNQRWAFVMGTTLVRFYDKDNQPEEMFYARRADAVRLAKQHGLHIDKFNNVTVAQEPREISTCP